MTTPRPPPPRNGTSSSGRSPRARKAVENSPYQCHVMGYAGYVPGGFTAVGKNVRDWLKLKGTLSRDDDVLLNNHNASGYQARIIGSSRGGAMTSRGESNSRGGVGDASPHASTTSSLSSASTINRQQFDGIQAPIVGYTGHVPGLNHCSKTQTGWSYHEAVNQCWNEAAPLNEALRQTLYPSRSGTGVSGSSSLSGTLQRQPGSCVPLKSHRGWSAFQTTSRVDYPNHCKGGATVGSDGGHFPDKLFSSYDISMTRRLSDAREESSSSRPGTGVEVGVSFAAPGSAGASRGSLRTAVKWIEEDSVLPRRSALDVLALVRTKIRSRVGSTGEIRMAFRHFTSSNANFITVDKWCNGLFLYGMNHFLRLSEAKAGFALADQNQDGLIDFGEFVTSVMGRLHDGPNSENVSERRPPRIL